MRALSLGFFLFVFWLALSGHYSAFLVGSGAAVSALGVYAASRMDVADREAHPIELLAGAVTYWPWLLWEIVKSGWNVTKVILNPKLPISPTMTVVQASQRTAAGLATYANSITLTPGTITTGVKGNRLTVHALLSEGAVDVESGAMDARVKRFEGNR